MFVTLAVKAIGHTPKPTFQRFEKANGKPTAKEVRPVYFVESKSYVETPVYERKGLLADHKIIGPAVIEQMDSTTLVLPGYEATVDDIGSLIICKK
jgi:N-methylhydantoinase A